MTKARNTPRATASYSTLAGSFAKQDLAPHRGGNQPHPREKPPRASYDAIPGGHPRAGGEYQETRGEFPRLTDRRGTGRATRRRPGLDPSTATWEATRKPRVSERTLGNLQAGGRRLRRGHMATVVREAHVSAPAARARPKGYSPGPSRAVRIPRCSVGRPPVSAPGDHGMRPNDASLAEEYRADEVLGAHGRIKAFRVVD